MDKQQGPTDSSQNLQQSEGRRKRVQEGGEVRGFAPNTNHFGDAPGFACVSGVWSQSTGPSGPLRQHNCSFNISEKGELVKIQDRSAALLKRNASLTLSGPLLASLLQFSVGFFSVFVPMGACCVNLWVLHLWTRKWKFFFFVLFF